MTDLWLDSKYAWRLARRTPLTVAVIVGSLALGIAANTAVFSFVNAIQFKALPVADEATLVDVSEWSATELCAGCGVGTSYPGFLEWQARAQSFSSMGAYKEVAFTVSGDGEPARVGGCLVSSELFPMIGRPAIPRAVDRAGGRIAERTAGRRDQRPAVAQPPRLTRRRHRPDAEDRWPRLHDRRGHAGRLPLAGVRAALGSARCERGWLGAQRSVARGRRPSAPRCGRPAVPRPRCAPSPPRRKLPTPRATPAGRRR